MLSDTDSLALSEILLLGLTDGLVLMLGEADIEILGDSDKLSEALLETLTDGDVLILSEIDVDTDVLIDSDGGLEIDSLGLLLILSQDSQSVYANPLPELYADS